jgi:hypothetical protein
MNGNKQFALRDWAMVGVFFVAGLLSRAPFRSQLAYHWDSVQLVLGVREYNVVLSQPHAPGYFLYVMLGRLVNLVVGDAHASLVWLSVVFGGGSAHGNRCRMFWRDQSAAVVSWLCSANVHRRCVVRLLDGTGVLAGNQPGRHVVRCVVDWSLDGCGWWSAATKCVRVADARRIRISEFSFKAIG